MRVLRRESFMRRHRHGRRTCPPPTKTASGAGGCRRRSPAGITHAQFNWAWSYLVLSPFLSPARITRLGIHRQRGVSGEAGQRRAFYQLVEVLVEAQAVLG